MSKLLKYLNAKEKVRVILGVLFVVVQVWLELKMPEYMSAITLLVKPPVPRSACAKQRVCTALQQSV